jgi:hypothetical protein
MTPYSDVDNRRCDRFAVSATVALLRAVAHRPPADLADPTVEGNTQWFLTGAVL